MSDIDLTFLAWADTHFGYEDGFDDIRHQALRQMNRLAGFPYPPGLGGSVGEPAFLLHCGDFVDGGGDGGRELALYLHCMKQAKLPTYETLGNHDIPSPDVVDFFVRKFGRKYYSFDRGGVHFLSLYRPCGIYDVIPPMDAEQLDWLRRDLAAAGGAPVVIFGHGRPEDVPNQDTFASAIRGAHVVLLLSGHTHVQWGEGALERYVWKGIPGIILGHCRDHPIDPLNGRTFVVVRMQGKQVAVVPWRWDLQRWAGTLDGEYLVWAGDD